MNPWIQLLGSGGLAAVAVVVVNALAQRRNLGSQTARTDAETQRTDAETDEIIAKTARGLVADVQADLARQKAINTELWERVEELERYADEWRRVLELHSAWDLMAISKLRECKPPITFPMPTPLTPPNKPRRTP